MLHIEAKFKTRKSQMINSKTITTAALVAFGVFASVEYTAVAQTGGTMMNQQSQTGLSALDRQFMYQAAQGGMAEVQLARLALQKSSSSGVKQYAQEMITDHTQANNQLKTLAREKGLRLPTTINSTQQALRRQLASLNGSSFDRTYINRAGVAAHTQQANIFQREVQMGQDPDVKAFAQQVLPIVEQHLQMARSMASNMTGSMSR
jgi:putative membrane protein